MDRRLLDFFNGVAQPLLLIVLAATYAPTESHHSTTFENQVISTAMKGVDDDGSLSMVTYNVWGLPVSLQGHDQEYRFNRLPEAIFSSDQEIICLQEVFHKSLQAKILDKNNTYFMGSDYSCSEDHILGLVKKDCYGGLMTFSQFPILSEHFYHFEAKNANLFENIGNKGFLITEVLRNGKPLIIVNTHLHADDNAKAERIRVQQLSQIKATLATYDSSTADVYMLGDFNLTNSGLASGHNMIIEEMGFVDLAPKLGDEYTYNSATNSYVTHENYQVRIDYIFRLGSPFTESSDDFYEAGLAFDAAAQLSDHFGWQVLVKDHEKSDVDLFASKLNAR